ncbi:apolipoprotein N-acyltransferase [Kitasatospora atroaurantiaca]|uniref:Apolipoprotein N-acyltransferase n=1 Tax=Kitasatospora atroaurantiaca TaxID=285545 RepID=A0A561EYS7_9ACTN|nr:apolipoprotein N-acyltransferase [Kitasatospora atroaurantiaca]TWE20761.1 apolipoprotein N-acyltransferase [Kitasatospora atroaurantiaca]
MTLRAALARPARYASLAAGALPVLAFPAPGLAALAWVALVPGLLLMQRAPSGREAAVRGWCFGAGFILTAMYWLVPSIGPGLIVLAVLFGALQAGLGLAVWRLLHPPVTALRALAALVVVPSVWVSTEFIRSWHALGGPWALLGASQWQHPAVLALASVGGAWLVSAAVVAANTGVLILLTARRPTVRVAAVGVTALAVAAGPALFALRTQPTPGEYATVALVQPGQVADATARFDTSARITADLVGRPLDLVVWAESSTTADLDRDTAALDRLRALSTATGAQLLAGEDARKADGRISKDAVLITPDGVISRYRKIRLVPFGEYIPLRPALGWIAGISKAAGENRAPGAAFHLLQASDRTGRPLPLGALICFESAFPDMSRAASDDGAKLIVYQSATSTFQHTWAPQQHASLGALRAAETGRPVVQASLTGESVAYDRQGRRLAHLGTSATGAVTVRLPLADPAARTWYDRLGDWVPLTAAGITLAAAAAALRPARRKDGPAAVPAPSTEPSQSTADA